MTTKPQPDRCGWLDVGEDHQIYWQEWGPQDAVPILFIHGGPGCGFDTSYLPLFDLQKTRLVTFDQRGCGQSRPLGGLAANTTQHLILDIEKVRTHLNIAQWHVTGHSWGTALAILYASSYPKKVKGMALTGLFAARTEDHIWCLEGAARFFPEVLDVLKKSTGITGTTRLDLALEQRMKKAARQEKEIIARSLSNYFRYIAFLTPLPPKEGKVSDREIAQWDIFLDYAKNDFYLDPLQGIYPYADQLKDIHISLLQGRFDMDCCPEQALLLKSLLPHIDLQIVPGNHDVGEDPMMSAFKSMLQRLAA